jgi:hypothetical protein
VLIVLPQACGLLHRVVCDAVDGLSARIATRWSEWRAVFEVDAPGPIGPIRVAVVVVHALLVGAAAVGRDGTVRSRTVSAAGSSAAPMPPAQARSAQAGRIAPPARGRLPTCVARCRRRGVARCSTVFAGAGGPSWSVSVGWWAELFRRGRRWLRRCPQRSRSPGPWPVAVTWRQRGFGVGWLGGGSTGEEVPAGVFVESVKQPGGDCEGVVVGGAGE